MPTLHWIGKDKVVNHHLDVPYRVLDHQYGFENGGQSNKETKSGNKIIHGDNLEALKALLPEYEGKIKCIYIDPPYNTGNEAWIYNDNVNDPKITKWLNGVVGKEGEDLSRHDKWLCMMYPRLKLLHKLLADDGFIGVSIDDNELYNLGIILNEIFGANKRLACIPVKAEPSGGKGKEALRIGHEYLLVYIKNNTSGLKLEEKNVEGKVLEDHLGVYTKGRELSKWGSESLRVDREDMWYPLYAPDGSEIYPYRNDGKEGRWRWGKNNPQIHAIIKNPLEAHWEVRKYDEGVQINEASERWFPFEKIRKDVKNFGWNTWLDKIGFNSEGTKQIKEIFEEKIFDTPKPMGLIKWLLNLMNDNNGLVLDSFAGSGTTANAVLSLNVDDDGTRKFILVEMEDYVDEITAERVKRVINGHSGLEGLGGTFDFYTLGEQLFLDGGLNENVAVEKLRSYIYYTETNQPLMPTNLVDNEYFLNSFNDTSYYFYYKKNDFTSLDSEFLSTIKNEAEQFIIYADNCLLNGEYMKKHNIVFKKIPRDISKF